MTPKDELKFIKKQKLNHLFATRPISIIIGIGVLVILCAIHLLHEYFQLNHYVSSNFLSLIMIKTLITFAIYISIIGVALCRGSSIALFIIYTLPLWLLYIGTFSTMILLYFRPQNFKQGFISILLMLGYVIIAKLCFFYKGSQQWFKECHKVRKLKVADISVGN